MKTLAIANQKGGVGKTTLTAHIAYAAQQRGIKTLLVDMDAQGSLTHTFVDEEDQRIAKTLRASHLYTNKVPELRPFTVNEHLDMVMADDALLSADRLPDSSIKIARANLKPWAKEYDLCLIDTPPLRGLRLMASMAAADYVLTPVSIGYYELKGVKDLMQSIRVVMTKGYNARLKHMGILPMKTNSRSKKQAEALQNLRQSFGKAIMPIEIPERAAVRHAVADRKPVWKGTKGETHKKAAQEWKAACDFILDELKLKVTA